MPEDEVTPPESAGPSPSEVAQLKLDNALLRAGVDLDSPQGKILAEAWTSRDPDPDNDRDPDHDPDPQRFFFIAIILTCQTIQ